MSTAKRDDQVIEYPDFDERERLRQLDGDRTISLARLGDARRVVIVGEDHGRSMTHQRLPPDLPR